jgi:hypothetical protein
MMNKHSPNVVLPIGNVWYGWYSGSVEENISPIVFNFWQEDRKKSSKNTIGREDAPTIFY